LSIGRGSLNRPGVPDSASFRQRRPPGVAETQQLCGLVEGLAGGVVERFAEQFVIADPRHAHQLRMPARYQQRDEAKGMPARGRDVG
jgi:hypothetical protein